MSPTSNIDGAQKYKAPLSKMIKLDNAPICEEQIISDINSEESQVYNVYDNVQSYEYFQRNATRDKCETGPAYMVGKAVIGTTHTYKYMTSDDILLHLLLAKFTATLSLEQKNMFCMILQLIMNKRDNGVKKRKTNDATEFTNYAARDSIADIVQYLCSSKIPPTIETRCPLYEAKMRQYYHQGPNSIIQNLPQPEVIMFHRH